MARQKEEETLGLLSFVGKSCRPSISLITAVASRLWHVGDQQATTINIFVDSLSVLQSLSQVVPKKNRFLLSQIQRNLQTLHRLEKSTSFHWVPGHIDVAGNERVDAAVRRIGQGREVNLIKCDGDFGMYSPHYLYLFSPDLPHAISYLILHSCPSLLYLLSCTPFNFLYIGSTF
ncbi:hypothetical protein Pcinc_012004 [Petrolisthes cinctipes]|uniref:RNase H type-1 domain-containing protein n=1 Tax=Petrolisthes cinctipes TaxID=88211 RepID=A0AAE1G1I5_PETCI|nr:hypothetical protein Pcinc_012004 [Petrolisthes cinctipes]